MIKRVLIWWLAAILLISVSRAEAQRLGKISRIGYLNPASYAAYSTRIKAFRQGLRDLGYVEGGKHLHSIPACGWET